MGANQAGVQAASAEARDAEETAGAEHVQDLTVYADESSGRVEAREAGRRA
ncbi:hypothetical protein ACQPZP_19925 [Spirillospora sp. CA-142024]|uniref:hypothetical protein n=1 Tax=Spirillospora sp. CA-142024 TaxID=3240036 RepID=UPI003D944737